MKADKHLIDHCETLIRAGRGAEAAKVLSKISSSRLSRELRLPLAQLCRRVGLNALGMKVLTPIIHPKGRKAAIALTQAAAELAEYAVLLQRLGAVNEALALLDRIDPAEHPEALLYRSYCLFNLWEYGSAIPFLSRYIQASSSPLAILVGRVNLSSALVATDRFEEASSLLQESVELAREIGHVRLEGNCFELLAQMRLLTGDHVGARQLLEQADQKIGPEQTFGRQYIKKWQAVLEARALGSVAPLRALRQEALEAGDWEGARDADFHALKIEFDEATFERLLYGSPMPAYRDRIQRALGRVIRSDSYLTGDPSWASLDCLSGSMEDGRQVVTPGTKSHQALAILLRDFYRPLRIAGLHSALFPGEHFNIFSSPDRVHQVLRRLRRELEAAGLPVEVSGTAGQFSIRIVGELSFRVQYAGVNVDRQHLLLSKLKESYSDSVSFTAREAARALEISVFAFRRLAIKAVDEGLLVKAGAGPSTIYRWPEMPGAHIGRAG